jgi:hypothetical protein
MKKLILLLSIITICFSSFSQTTIGDSLTFETLPINGLYIDADTNNQWQIGKPNKALFNSNITGNASIVTDTLETYTPGIKSSFTINIMKYLNDFPYMWYDIDFKHAMNCDSLAGGYIEISYDSLRWYNITMHDSIWMNFGADMLNNYGSTPYNDTLFNGQIGFTGNFSNANFHLTFGVMPILFRQENDWIAFNPPFIRFNFISDSLATPYDGWMLDNLFLMASSGGSVDENLASAINIYPNPVNDKLIIDIDSKTFHPTQIQIINIKGQKLLQVGFDSKYIDVSKLPQGSYFLTLTDNKGNSAAKMFYKQ